MIHNLITVAPMDLKQLFAIKFASGYITHLIKITIEIINVVQSYEYNSELFNAKPV